jgi:amino-acid N-acetyltransferase
VFLHNGEVVVDEKRRGSRGSVVHNLPLSLAQAFENKLRESLGNKVERLRHSDQDPTSDQWRLQFLDYLQGAIAACKGGTRRVHLVSRFTEGAVVAELYTREGSGIMVTRDVYEGVRQARPEDVQAIMQLITPLEQQGILVTRPPEQVEAEIDKFIVFERDGDVLACCQLVHYEDERFEGGSAEMCCVAVAESQRGSSLGSALLSYCMRSCALELGCTELFVLTTRSQHWFTDRGFVEASPERLPPKKRAVYNYKRKPKIYFKHISSERAADEYDLQFH